MKVNAQDQVQWSKTGQRPSHFPLDTLLQHIPPHIATTFDNAQLDALEQALNQRSRSHHTVDIRISAPFWPRFYLVVLAGSEQRSPARRAQERQLHPLWTPVHGLIVVGSMAVSSLLLLGLLLLQRVDPIPLHKATAPAGIPFKDDPASCEQSGRIWQAGECLDYEHDPMF
ncbi:MAG: hypothetical protein ICV77_08510 [Cyanobacteria bacterium Co-bin8]|nr:hypothetical protein [Cyanobacteria bacterium Co-bin8]